MGRLGTVTMTTSGLAVISAPGTLQAAEKR
jgi:hypothetical protein